MTVRDDHGEARTVLQHQEAVSFCAAGVLPASPLERPQRQFGTPAIKSPCFNEMSLHGNAGWASAFVLHLC